MSDWNEKRCWQRLRFKSNSLHLLLANHTLSIRLNVCLIDWLIWLIYWFHEIFVVVQWDDNNNNNNQDAQQQQQQQQTMQKTSGKKSASATAHLSVGVGLNATQSQWPSEVSLIRFEIRFDLLLIVDNDVIGWWMDEASCSWVGCIARGRRWWSRSCHACRRGWKYNVWMKLISMNL